METCKRCDASSWMVSLTENGLCRRCNLFVVNRVQLAAERIHRSLALFRQVEEAEVRLRHAKRIVRLARVLEEFEEMEIETVRPAPSRLADLFAEVRDRLKERCGPEEVVEARDSMESPPAAESPDAGTLPGPGSFGLAATMDPLDSFSLRGPERADRPEGDPPD